MLSEINSLKELLQVGIEVSWDEFRKELHMEENTDYRRGFLAGMLCGRLQLRADIADVEAISSELPHEIEENT